MEAYISRIGDTPGDGQIPDEKNQANGGLNRREGFQKGYPGQKVGDIESVNIGNKKKDGHHRQPGLDGCELIVKLRGMLMLPADLFFQSIKKQPG